MAGKRKPGTELNHDNWDQEEPPEEAGEFQRAPNDTLQERKMLRPRRRLAKPAGTTSATPFSGFSLTPSNSTSAATTTPSSTSLFANFKFSVPSNTSAASTVPLAESNPPTEEPETGQVNSELLSATHDDNADLTNSEEHSLNEAVTKNGKEAKTHLSATNEESTVLEPDQDSNGHVEVTVANISASGADTHTGENGAGDHLPAETSEGKAPHENQRQTTHELKEETNENGAGTTSV